ncbi:MAG: hypothetical protein IPI58_07730 [Alphaproteobacteria bacterium]|nr:MAG: hypothetical protein IPI58_07730 [Alphaproteobacteria bacterium]
MKNKAFKIWAAVVLFAAVGIGYIKGKTHWPIEDMALAQRDIDRQVEATHLTGQKGEVSFKTSSHSFLLMSPPYASLSQFTDKALTPALVKEMEAETNMTETGHLFLVRGGRIIDHRLLSTLAEPILGSAEGTEFIFSITREGTSGRPIRIELVKR